MSACFALGMSGACRAAQGPSSNVGARPAATESADPRSAASVAADVAAPPMASEGGASPAAVTPSPRATTANEPPQPVLFPPADIQPPHPRSAHPGDGKWLPLGKAGERAAEGRPALYSTVIHPHEASRFMTLTLVAIDLSAVELRFLAGKEDVGERKVPFSPGLIEKQQQDRLLAVFNGGFQPRHGRWGMQVGDANIVPPRATGCTVALYADASVRIRTWPAIAGTDMQAFRQTPPCLVEEGELHRDLSAGRDKVWGGQTPGVVTRRRSTIGIDATGRILFYAIGVETPLKVLAEGMRIAGARSVAQLDINWNWTQFLLFGQNAQGELRVSSTLVEGVHTKSGYVERAAERDFFYLLRRSGP